MVIRRFAAVCAALVLVGVAPSAGVAQDGGVLGEATTRIDRAAVAPVVDGLLDDDAWANAQPLSAFIQVDPDNGQVARAETIVRAAWDDDGLYVAARMADPPGRTGTRVEGMRRDFSYANADVFGVVLDGFGDARFAMAFLTNPDGVQRDILVFDGGDTDEAWNGVWRVRTRRDDGGWTAEFSIPWSTLRYGNDGQWRANFIREARAIQETSGWSPWRRGIDPWDLTYAGALEGLDPPDPGVNLQVVPYAVGRSSADGVSLFDGSRTEDVGLDVKWAASPRTVVDLTFNTDFAQAEVDRQVVNLDRFSVFFPERRTFFLESVNLFDTGLDVISPFYSRRIGLDDAGVPVQVNAGGRVTHRSATSNAGALVVHQGGANGIDGTVFGVGRFSRNVGATGRIGGLVATRHDQGVGAGVGATNTAAAIDFFARPTRTLTTRGMVSRTFTDGAGGDGWAAHAWVGNNATWGYIGWLQEYVGAEWEPRSGFSFTSDVIVTSPAFNLDLRPDWLPSSVRNLQPGATVYLFNRASTGDFFSGSVRTSPFAVGFQNGGRFWFAAVTEWQTLNAPFGPVPGLSIASGDYDFTGWEVAYEHDPSANVSGSITLREGPFYDGDLTKSTLTGKLALSPHAVAFASWERNDFRNVGGSNTTTHLVRPELRLAVSPRLEVSGIWQYNTAFDISSVNLRLAWEFKPLSFLYVVYNDNASLDGSLTPFPTQRQLIMKATWLWQP
ncbi:MAG: DUF5916 domain-containing protein [Gemmatimonadota bacterium]